MGYVLWIAWRYLRTRVRQTVLTLTGVALGVTIVTLMQSYMGGFLGYFVDRALQTTPDVTVTQQTEGLPNPAAPAERALRAYGNPLVAVAQLPVPETEEELENPRLAEAVVTSIPGVVAVAPFVSGQGLIVNGDQREPVNFQGIRPLVEARVTRFDQQLIAGTPADLAGSANGIILGVLLADNISAVIGDRVTIISQEGIARRLQVVGLYRSQLREVDEVRAYINLRPAQQLMAIRGWSGLAVRTASLDDAPRVARQIEARTDYRARTWREVNANVLDLFTTISMIMYLVVGLTMIVAGFGIANTLVLTVNEKQRDIGVLKALGVPPARIAQLFVLTGIILGLAGVVIGEILGALGILALTNTPVPFGQGEDSPALIDVQTFPMLQIPRVYIVSAVFGMLISVASSVLPSLRAAKADPLVVIRGAE